MRPRMIALTVVTALSLAACTTPLPEPQPEAVPAVVPSAVTVEQVEDVLADVSAVIAAADEQSTAELLDSRVTGAAREIRQVEYALRVAGDTEAVTPIPEAAQTIIAPQTDTWPRPVLVVTEPPADLQPPLLLALQQDEPRAQYRLSAWVRLFPGVEMPTTAQPQLGSPVLAPDSDALTVPPGEVIGRYVDLLTNGAASAQVPFFAEDPLRVGIAATRDAYTAVVGENGTLTETYQPNADAPIAIGTADGGAIVVGGFRTVTTITLSESTLNIGDQTAALLGGSSVRTNLAMTWLSTVAFVIPPAGSTEPVRMLGAEHSLVGVTGE